MVVMNDQRVALRGVAWGTYLRLAEEVGDCATLMAFNRGVLELMSQGMRHERVKKRIDRLVALVSEELDLPLMSFGSTRWLVSEAERGVEADGCYMLTREKVEACRGRSRNVADYPFPDLVVEVDMSWSAVDREGIYGAMKVAEVWRFDEEVLHIERLKGDGTYDEVLESGFLGVKAEEVTRWLHEVGDADDNAWARRLRGWVRGEVVGRRKKG